MHWGGMLEECMAIYVPDTRFSYLPNQCTDEELGIIGRIATKEIFVITDMNDVCELKHGNGISHKWVVENIQESGCADLEGAIAAIYEDAMKICKVRDDRFLDMPYQITFLTLWSTESSRDWETGIVDDVWHTYEGPGEIVLKKP